MAITARAACIGVIDARICILSSATIVEAATKIAAITNIRTTMHVWQVDPRFGVCFDRVSIEFLLYCEVWLTGALYKSHARIALRYWNFTSVS